MVSFVALTTIMALPIMPFHWLDGVPRTVSTIGSFETVGAMNGAVMVMDTLNDITIRWVSTMLQPMPCFKPIDSS